MRLLNPRIACLAIGAAGCITSANFTPYSSTSTRPAVLTQAVRAYEGDIPALASAGAELVGTVETSGKGFTGSSAVEKAAAKEGAAHGGTHYLLVGMVSETETSQLAPPTSTTTYSGNTAHTTHNPGSTINITRHQNTIMVVRVPWANLRMLPEPLWPKKGLHYAVKLKGSKPPGAW